MAPPSGSRRGKPESSTDSWSVPGLSLLSAPPGSTDSWASGGALRGVLQQLAEDFDLVVVDLPPVGTHKGSTYWSTSTRSSWSCERGLG